MLCAELRDGGDARVHVHEPGTFVPLLQAEGGATYAVVNDHLGMPKELVDAKGRVAWAASHSAWGQLLEVQRDEGAAEVESPFRLLGQYADDETGLCYTRFRYFDAAAGRWCSPDPLGIAGGANLAAFDSAPSVGVDPLGLACNAGGAQSPWMPGTPVQLQTVGPRGLVAYRAHGPGGARGAWLTPKPIPNRQHVRQQLAVLPAWNPATEVSTVRIAPGTLIRVGTVGPQGALPGGGEQIEVVTRSDIARQEVLSTKPLPP